MPTLAWGWGQTVALTSFVAFMSALSDCKQRSARRGKAAQQRVSALNEADMRPARQQPKKERLALAHKRTPFALWCAMHFLNTARMFSFSFLAALNWGVPGWHAGSRRDAAAAPQPPGTLGLPCMCCRGLAPAHCPLSCCTVRAAAVCAVVVAVCWPLSRAKCKG